VHRQSKEARLRFERDNTASRGLASLLAVYDEVIRR